ncbi:MAG: hypothetical protein MRY63_07940 [Neomegalonema sp.]|nr:hypothetical protein [Neomegalonema sp.]
MSKSLFLEPFAQTTPAEKIALLEAQREEQAQEALKAQLEASFDDGYRAGLEKAEELAQDARLRAIETVAEELRGLRADIGQAQGVANAQAGAALMSALEALLPALCERGFATEAVAVLEAWMGDLDDAPLTLRAAPDCAQILSEALAGMAPHGALHGEGHDPQALSATITSDPALPPLNFELHVGERVNAFDLDAPQKNILAILARLTAPKPSSSHCAPEPSPMGDDVSEPGETS